MKIKNESLENGKHNVTIEVDYVKSNNRYYQNVVNVYPVYSGDLKIEPYGSYETWNGMIIKHVLGNIPLETNLMFGLSSALVAMIGSTNSIDTLIIQHLVKQLEAGLQFHLGGIHILKKMDYSPHGIQLQMHCFQISMVILDLL
jgi:hypothetical protein